MTMLTRLFSRSAKRSQPRPRVAPLWRNRWLLASAGVLLAVGAGAAAWTAWQQELGQTVVEDAEQAALDVTADAGFVVRDVFVVGRTATPKKTLLDALGVNRGMPILGIDLYAARDRVQALPWVRHASVRRSLPDIVIVEIVERKPLALWQHDKQFALIDDEGQVLSRDDVSAFRNLMIVVGEDAPANASALVQMLATEPDLMKQVRAAVRIGGRRWDLRLEQGTDIKLPEEEPQHAWHELAAFDREHALLAKNLQCIDLRLPDRLVIRPGLRASEVKAGGDA